jgi:hypothetical protein
MFLVPPMVFYSLFTTVRDLQRIARNSSVQVGDLSMKQVSSLPLSLYQLLGYAFLHPFFINLLMIFLQIKELDVSEIVKGTLGSSRIPTLEEALALISNSVRKVILDAKVGPPMYEKGLAQDILSIVSTMFLLALVLVKL